MIGHLVAFAATSMWFMNPMVGQVPEGPKLTAPMNAAPLMVCRQKVDPETTKRLDCNGTETVNLQNLVKLRNLKYLGFSGVKDLDLGPLASLKHLVMLSLRDVGVRDWSPLRKFISLERLTLFDLSEVTDLSALGGLSALKRLTLNNVKTTDLSFLAPLIEAPNDPDRQGSSDDAPGPHKA